MQTSSEILLLLPDSAEQAQEDALRMAVATALEAVRDQLEIVVPLRVDVSLGREWPQVPVQVK